MRHARPDDLEMLAPLLDDIRAIDGLTERTPGSFYRKSEGFVHFHADGDDRYADVKFVTEFERVRVTTRREQTQLGRRIRRHLETA